MCRSNILYIHTPKIVGVGLLATRGCGGPSCADGARRTTCLGPRCRCAPCAARSGGWRCRPQADSQGKNKIKEEPYMHRLSLSHLHKHTHTYIHTQYSLPEASPASPAPLPTYSTPPPCSPGPWVQEATAKEQVSSSHAWARFCYVSPSQPWQSGWTSCRFWVFLQKVHRAPQPLQGVGPGGGCLLPIRPLVCYLRYE